MDRLDSVLFTASLTVFQLLTIYTLDTFVYVLSRQVHNCSVDVGTMEASLANVTFTIRELPHILIGMIYALNVFQQLHIFIAKCDHLSTTVFVHMRDSPFHGCFHIKMKDHIIVKWVILPVFYFG